MCAEFGNALLVDIDKKRLQRFLDGLSERFCHDTVSGCYIYLKAVFAEAVEQRMVPENPTKTLALPHTRERDTYTVSFEDVRLLEDALEGRDKVIFKLLSRYPDEDPFALFTRRLPAEVPPLRPRSLACTLRADNQFVALWTVCDSDPA
jgi:hypothetical protein